MEPWLNDKDIEPESTRDKRISRRKLFGMGIAGAAFLTGLLSTTPAGRVIAGRMAEEIGHEILAVKHKPVPETWSDSNLTIAWLGHAGFLLNFFGTRILIDPTLGERIGVTPLGNVTVGPKRYIASPITASEIGQVDLLLVSHAHTDHFDYPTLRALQSQKTTVVTAKNTTPLWEGLKYGKIVEMHWGDTKSLAGVEVRAIEGKHWGARLPWYKGMEANSLLISKHGVNIFFGGDTGYTDLIQQQLKDVPIHVAMMGIAAYLPKSFEARHANPEQAWQMTKEMGAKWIIPMHWGTFRLSQEPMGEPITRFLQAAAGNLDKIVIQETGATWIMPR